MKLVDKLVWKDLIGPFINGLLMFMLLIFAAAYMFPATDLLVKGVPVELVARIILYSLPSVVTQTFPMAMLLAGLMAFGRLSADREAVALFRDRVHRGPTRWALGGVLFASSLARDREVAGEAARALDEAGPHPSGLFDVAIGRARAWAALAVDDPARARSELEKATALARGRSNPVEEASCLHDRVRIGDAADIADRLARLAERCDGTLVTTMASHAAAVTNGDADRLEKVAEDFAEMGYLLKAAEAAMGASEAAARAGDQRRAARLSVRAAELAERCETPATPMLTSPGGPVPLTNREREVAILAASGLTSRAIADRLFLSARTVDNHLARIYSKLGITSRAELTAAIA